MKTSITKTLLMLFACICLSKVSFAQAPPVTNPLLNVNIKLRNLFTPLSRPTPKLDYLYDMSGHVTDDKFWRRISYDTSNTDNWFKLYWESFYMAYDTSSLQNYEVIYENVLQYAGDTVQLGVLDKQYYCLKSNALTSKKYFNFDTINNADNSLTVGTNIKLDDNKFSKGLYIVNITNGIESFSQKLIVE